MAVDLRPQWTFSKPTLRTVSMLPRPQRNGPPLQLMDQYQPTRLQRRSLTTKVSTPLPWRSVRTRPSAQLAPRSR